MVNWRVTAATIYCEDLEGEVTIMVYKDGSAICTGYHKQVGPQKGLEKQVKKKNQRLKGELRCTDPECERVTGYRDKLFREESEKAGAAGS
jgi:hypothetical protein